MNPGGPRRARGSRLQGAHTLNRRDPQPEPVASWHPAMASPFSQAWDLWPCSGAGGLARPFCAGRRCSSRAGAGLTHSRAS